MKLSILNWQIHTDIDLSRKWAEVIELSREDSDKLRAKTHSFDVNTKELVEIPQPEPTPIPEPTEEEIRETKIQEVEKLLLRKQAMELVWETTVPIAEEIVQKSEEIIDLMNISKTEKSDRKLVIMEKL